MTILARISDFIEFKGVSFRQFESSIGASNGLISGSLKKSTDIGSKWLSKIIEIYPDINPTWLLTGNGEMLLTNEPTSHTRPQTDIHKNIASEELKEYMKMLEQCQKRYAQLMEKVDFKDKQLEKLQEQLNKSKAPTGA